MLKMFTLVEEEEGGKKLVLFQRIKVDTFIAF